MTSLVLAADPEPAPEAELRAAVVALRGAASHSDAARLWGIELVAPSQSGTSRWRAAGGG